MEREEVIKRIEKVAFTPDGYATKLAHQIAYHVNTNLVLSGMTISELAKLSGVDKGTVQDLVNAVPTVAVSDYVAVLWAMGCELTMTGHRILLKEVRDAT